VQTHINQFYDTIMIQAVLIILKLIHLRHGSLRTKITMGKTNCFIVIIIEYQYSKVSQVIKHTRCMSLILPQYCSSIRCPSSGKY